ncbi:hypothetical protein VFPPC_17776 [Pochonia chlamydosporia 170]|uniref:Uncharacterized protein n=1 Tax=Pochonia chlamydosporia 170 TaxID=1380566 RepID=A0A219AQI9_METCM|nr:hypothetical protein VFPPC_17776 [Pochonia chlamydosporia 170]OWT43048.1 hypothetical protein VFPPC_17776 [Pochonia chlamydosporia 170]
MGPHATTLTQRHKQIESILPLEIPAKINFLTRIKCRIKVLTWADLGLINNNSEVPIHGVGIVCQGHKIKQKLFREGQDSSQELAVGEAELYKVEWNESDPVKKISRFRLTGLLKPRGTTQPSKQGEARHDTKVVTVLIIQNTQTEDEIPAEKYPQRIPAGSGLPRRPDIKSSH